MVILVLTFFVFGVKDAPFRKTWAEMVFILGDTLPLAASSRWLVSLDLDTSDGLGEITE